MPVHKNTKSPWRFPPFFSPSVFVLKVLFLLYILDDECCCNPASGLIFFKKVIHFATLYFSMHANYLPSQGNSDAPRSNLCACFFFVFFVCCIIIWNEEWTILENKKTDDQCSNCFLPLWAKCWNCFSFPTIFFSFFVLCPLFLTLFFSIRLWRAFLRCCTVFFFYL